MNEQHAHTPFAIAGQDALEARFALRVAARLTEQSEALAPDLAERLRFARGQALERARQARSAQAALEPAVALKAATSGGGGGGDAGDDDRPSLWARAASILPLVALLVGLIVIQESNRRAQIAEAAAIDAALLADDLPPLAYSDPGFVEFLNASSSDE